MLVGVGTSYFGSAYTRSPGLFFLLELFWPLISSFSLLSFKHCLLLFPLLLGLLLEDSFVLHEDYLLHQDTFVGVNHTVDSFVVLWELPDSFSLHIQGDVCALKVILILVVEL